MKDKIEIRMVHKPKHSAFWWDWTNKNVVINVEHSDFEDTVDYMVRCYARCVADAVNKPELYKPLLKRFREVVC